MAFVLVITGLIMVVTGARNTYAQFGSQVASEFVGDGNFTYWLASLGAVGSLGYIDNLREFSRYFMALIVIAMVLNKGNQGLFQNFMAFLQKGPKAPNAVAGASSGASSGNVFNNIGGGIVSGLSSLLSSSTK